MNTGEIKKIGTLTIEAIGLGRIKVSDEKGKEVIFCGQKWEDALLEFKRLSLQ